MGWSFAQERRDHDPDGEDDEQRTETGHEELTRGIVFSASPASLAWGVTFSGQAFLGFPFCHGLILTQIPDFRCKTPPFAGGNYFRVRVIGGFSPDGKLKILSSEQTIKTLIFVYNLSIFSLGYSTENGVPFLATAVQWN